MHKFYRVNDELGRWDVDEIIKTIRKAGFAAGIRFDNWRGTTELKRYVNKQPTEEWCDISLHHDPDALNPQKITNGDMNLTTNLDHFIALDQQLFGNSGRRGRVVDGVGIEEPAMPDSELCDLIPFFKGTIIEQLHDYAKLKFGGPVRMRCQNRTVDGISQGLYWHKDDPVENRHHIPLWTNPGHVLLFSERNFKWKAGFDPIEAQQAMDFVGHYIPADGKVYEIFTKDYMHAVASVGVGWYQPRYQQTRCHLSLWPALN